MKILKRVLLLLISVVLILIVYNYPKLNIIAGYSAKNMNSSVFLAGRTLQFTDSTDNHFSPINLASDLVDVDTKSASSSVFGLLTRTAIYREGLGSVLITDDFDTSVEVRVPKRTKPDNLTAFPLGNAEQKDSVLTDVNYNKLNKTVGNLFTNHTQTRAVVVIHKNQIIAEKYAKGFTKNARILGWSMTKSIMSTVFGILQTQGKINVFDKAPITEWQNDDRKNITINNLLQMNSGLAWDENYNEISDVTKMLFLEKDMTKIQAKKQFAGKPNETWSYSSGTTNLLSGILRNIFKTHQEYLDYWYTQLIDKIGMNSMVIETDMAGNYVGSSYAWATPRDWAKFGLLYLNNGNWNGEQLFDASWVDYVTTPTNGSNGTYGAQFWLNANGQFPDVPKNMFYADGYQGQFVFVFPDQDLVVVRMGLSHIDINAFLKGVLESIK
ncbi:6-aminohexanoate-dimer hydrolase [Polaribacter huanghezhanensis]|uniref:serine hydrolase domain-containing protein n=1 Tax=Polaribacter huanghezhanensis TaxID=1354726 RepID=UPI002649F4FD|nr:serine hydrolase [Polaribacter huanghezhanensis]WKD85307.1 6-aminohexanoate-dimer hydrolase [Polaribacter huanghezhanensis]